MNLVAFSIKTKGIHNFARRLWTVFARFGFSEAQTRRALHTIVDALRKDQAAPTFFIPAVVLRRHPRLIAEIAGAGAEIGIHGYVHNDYRFLDEDQQYEQTKKAMTIFRDVKIPYYGFRNPYLGWNEASLRVFSKLGLFYESNEAVLHEVIDPDQLLPLIRSGYEKSLKLFQAIPCNAYALRPRFEGELLRIPTSIPDDEMLFDRLRITDPHKVGAIWGDVLRRVYDLGGIYTLNLHPERGVLCRQALETLLAEANKLSLPTWKVRLDEVAQWWKERSQFRFRVSEAGTERWQVELDCTPRATVLARHLTVEDAPTSTWSESVTRVVTTAAFTVKAAQCPCIGLSSETPKEVSDFLHEQGYAVEYNSDKDKHSYALFLDLPQGLGDTKKEGIVARQKLVETIEALEAPLVSFGCWPEGNRAALSVTGDIDSVTVQDFFLRILEVR